MTDNFTANNLAVTIRRILDNLLYETTVERDEAVRRIDAAMMELQPYLESYGQTAASKELLERRLELSTTQADIAYKNIFLNGHSGLTLQLLCILVHENLELVRRALKEA